MREDTLSPERNTLYKAQFDSLSENTSEYREMRQFFEAEIFPRLPAMEHFLDIGAGRGNYARPFSLLFEQTTIVEPNDVFVNEILVWTKDAGSKLTAFNISWQDLEWQDGETDLVLMSHMLYYVPKAQRSAFIRKAYGTLKKGGLMLIVLNSETCGIRDVYKTFYTKDLLDEMPYGEAIAVLLRSEGYSNVEERIFPAVITLPNREETSQLIDFLLLRRVPFDDEAAQSKREAFIDANLLHDGKYLMDSRGTIVILQKD
jgi:ubiquinone/menaquinone biosynthesis C-methylase UbiE